MAKISRVFKILIGIISGLIALILICAAGIIAAVFYFNAPPDTRPLSTGDLSGITLEEGGTVLFEVRDGETASGIGRRLEQAHLIKNRHFWNILSRLENKHLKTGTYRLTVPASQTEIRSVLVEGRQILFRITIPEGVTLLRAASIFDKSVICSGQDFLKAARDKSIIASYKIPNDTMEGYLYPETYYFPGSYPAERVVKTMADTFFTRIKEIAPESVNLSPKELNDIVILASIVEREYRVADEAPLMAGVFYNRMRIDMNLESCATVQYVITDIQGKPHPHILYFEDIAIKNPYNTYINAGLPPGPISAPGRTALNAAFHPENTEFLFFRLLNEATGRHTFSKTLDAHIQAGALFVKR